MDSSCFDLDMKTFKIGKGQPLAFLLGPCVIESETHALQCAEYLSSLARLKGFSLIFKASYDKANRSAHSSFRGVGLEEGLRILEKVRQTFGIPVLTDVHSPEEATIAGAVCDMIQIPAFLCRQTDLILAAGKSGAAVNVKKGQFLAPWDVEQIVEKLRSVNCHRMLLTDRGTSFGYNNLVSDMRSIPIMAQTGYPTCFDASHSVQLPGGLGNMSGGQRHFIPTLARAAVASGVDSLFIECHPNPEQALSDKHTVYPFDKLGELLDSLIAFRNTYLAWSQ
jgi:2-dehydro-3-deoxyphosphooctonate aldolase (KDO 8-P synthase)